MTALLRVDDPGRISLRRGFRAAILVPPMFAFGELVLDDVNFAVFAAFGTFALLAIADFGGPPWPRARAYLLTALAGAALIVIGTAVSSSPIAATAATIAIVFAIRYLGVLGGYLETATVTLILAFVLAVAIEAPLSDLGARLAGWLLAGALAAAAALLLWPHYERGRLRVAAARACSALAEELRSGPGPAASAGAETVVELRGAFMTARLRPAGPWEKDRSLRGLVDELIRTTVTPAPVGAGYPEQDRALAEATASLLDDTAELLAGAGRDPDVLALERRRVEHRAAIGERAVAELRGGERAERVLAHLDASFRWRVLSYEAISIAANAIVVSGGTAPGPEGFEVPPEAPTPRNGDLGTAATAVRQLRGQLGGPSARVRDSARAAVGLAAAVLVATAGEVSHGFWVVLATLLVLKSNAAGTRRNALEAIAGTTGGFLVASALMVAIGADTTALWIALPVAAFLAGYTPTAIHFLVGQGAFTLLVVVLFNLVELEGWIVGLVRLEDVALGAGVSLLIGLLVWPHGARAALPTAAAEALRCGCRYLELALAVSLGGERDEARIAALRVSLLAAAARCAEATREHWIEDGRELGDEDLRAMIDGPRYLRASADGVRIIRRLYGEGPTPPSLAAAGAALIARFEGLADRLGGAEPDPADRERLRGALGATRADALAALRAGAGEGAIESPDAALAVVMIRDWLELLDRFADTLDDPVAVVAAGASGQWWRRSGPRPPFLPA